MEDWRDVVGYGGLYKVSNTGKIKSFHFNKEKELAQLNNGSGYLFVRLTKYKTEPKRLYVHRIVAESFLNDFDVKLQVNHIDENKQNNNVENLNMMTAKENMNHGTGKKRASSNQRNNNCSKAVLQYNFDGTLLNEFPSVKECGRQGFISSAVSRCCRKITKTHKGFIWKYKK